MAKEYILKDRYGKDHTFNDETIYVRGTDGELMPFTQGTVEPLEITENGTYTAPDGVSYNPVTVNVDITKITILREQKLSGFALDNTFGYIKVDENPPYTINVGEKYYVAWDGVDYETTAMSADSVLEGAVFIGNGAMMGLPGNNEPFSIAYMNGMIGYCAFSDASESHTVGIWQDAVKLQDKTVTENGEYTADAGYDGLGKVTVEVAGSGGSGGSSNDVRYVTFMSYDGLIEYGKKAVAVGDDCADPIARGVFDTPTRESDAQYSYTFYGWATTPNGAADSSALKAVEEDRTVYANFASAVRYYTITYYDSDGTTVLKTESLAYGTVPSYAPTKSGYDFVEWEPKVVPVVGNASYSAVWTEEVSFATSSWERIAEISKSGKARDYFSIGDTKTIELNFSGTIERVEVRIIGFDHDNWADGSGKAGISIALAQGFLHEISDGREGNYIIWSNSETRRRFYVSGTVGQAIPTELRNVIKSVTKISNGGYSTDCDGKEKNSLYTTSEFLWLLSSTEIGLDNYKDPTQCALGQGEKYEYYTSANARKATRSDGKSFYYATRSMNSASLASFIGVVSSTGAGYTGALGFGTSSYCMPVIFGFCI